MFKMQRMNNNRSVQYKEGTNLLDAGSSDSELEQFSLPQNLNLKGSKKKPKNVKKENRTSCCSLGTSLTLLGLVILTAVVGAMGAFTYSLREEIKELKNKSKDAQGSNEGSLDQIMSIKSKQSELEKVIKDIQTGDKGLDKIQASIDEIRKQVATLNATTKELTKGIAQAPQLASLPGTVSDLSANVASLGSEIQGLKDKNEEIESFKTQTKSNIESLTTKVNAFGARPDSPSDAGSTTAKPAESPAPTPTPVDNSAATQALEEYVTRSVERFNKDLTAINGTVFLLKGTSDKYRVVLEEMRQNASALDQRVAAVEMKVLVGGDAGPSGADMGAIVNNVLEELKNATIDQRTEVDHLLLQEQEYKVSNVSARLTELTQRLDAIRAAGGNEDVAGLEKEFMQYTTNNDVNMKAMRTTLDQLTSKVENIESSMGLARGDTEGSLPGDTEGNLPEDTEGSLSHQEDTEGPQGPRDTATTPAQLPPEIHSTTTTTEVPDYGSGDKYDDYDSYEYRNYDAYDTDDTDEQRNKRLVSDEEVSDLLNNL